MEQLLGRRVPPDFEHVAKYPYTAETPAAVEHVLKLPSWHWSHNQGAEGSCVGHGTVMERAITNTGQNFISNILNPGRRYNPIELWNKAKLRDGDPSTNPGDDNGTTVRAGYDVCKKEGLSRVKSMILKDGVPVPVGAQPEDLTAGIAAYRWATTVDQIRAAIGKSHLPVTIGVNWYTNFDEPTLSREEHWIGTGNLGKMRGGHCVCLYGVSDRRAAFKVKNSWGRDYPLVWLTFSAMARLLREDGEAALITDR